MREKEYIEFCDQIDKIIKNFDLDQIVDMDETATQFDMTRDRTLDYVGAKSIDAAHSGHIKDGFIVDSVRLVVDSVCSIL